VHRCGRTGRGGKKGIAHTFFTSDEKGLSGELINVLKSAGMDVPENLKAFGTVVKVSQLYSIPCYYTDLVNRKKCIKSTVLISERLMKA